jgi:stearoyl-CoA desaturase (delta-9 desaturase)
MVQTVEPPANEYVGKREENSGRSYKAMYEEIFAGELDPSKPVAKPSPEEQAKEPTSKKIPLSNVYGTRMRNAFRNRNWAKRDIGRAIFFTLVHGLALMAPFYFSWRMFITQFIIYVFSALGITYSYHRQLAHKSFKSKKWFEYLWATWGMMGMQGAPLDWASEHRYHHLHTETPYDPHSIWEGFYWSHMGWLLDAEKKEERCADMSNAMDMQKQAFYRLTSKYYKLFVLLHWSLFYAIGGTAGLVWRAFWVMVQYHVTWCVNSASHLWGNQEFKSGDNSRNNWWVGILAFGEGWHNNHHAFEYSARHGLRRKQFDMTYMAVRLFERLGLVSGVKLPTQKNMDRLRINPETTFKIGD